MNRSLSMLALSALMLAPLGYLIATSDLSTDRGLMVTTGAVAASVLLLLAAWRMHAKGKLLPYRCRTCQSPMARVKPGELRPPPGHSADSITWRCRRCGRLE